MGVKVPGPDPSDDLHALPFGFLKRFLGWTSEIDWAGQLNSGLTTPSGAQAASKTVPGVVQLATAAQAQAATNDTSVLTPLQGKALVVAQANPTVANLAALTTITTATFPLGTPVTVLAYSGLTSSASHFQSQWLESPTGSYPWTPAPGSSIQLQGDTSDSDFAAACQAIMNQVVATNSNLFVPATTMFVSVTSNRRLRWNGGALAPVVLESELPFTPAKKYLQTIASFGTGAIAMMPLTENNMLIQAHLVAPNYDKNFLWFVTQSVYSANGGTITQLANQTIANSPGYNDPSLSISNYTLMGLCSNAGSGTSPISARINAIGMGAQ